MRIGIQAVKALLFRQLRSGAVKGTTIMIGLLEVGRVLKKRLRRRPDEER